MCGNGDGSSRLAPTYHPAGVRGSFSPERRKISRVPGGNSPTRRRRKGDECVRTSLRARATLQTEILALRHQLQVPERSRRQRVRLTHADRMLWVWRSKLWSSWRTNDAASSTWRSRPIPRRHGPPNNFVGEGYATRHVTVTRARRQPRRERHDPRTNRRADLPDLEVEDRRRSTSAHCLQRSPDIELVNRARADSRIVLTCNLDFGEILALGVLDKPSVILFRLADDQ